MAETAAEPLHITVVGEGPVPAGVLRLIDSSGHHASSGADAQSAVVTADTDMVIECGEEDLAARRAAVGVLLQRYPDDVPVAVCTLVTPVAEIGNDLDGAHRLVGTHFMLPAERLRLCELIVPEQVPAATEARVASVLERLGVDAVRTEDRAGFVVNRLLLPLLFEAVRTLDEGAATMDDIDLAMRRGCGWPAGPFEILDLVGLDVAASSGRIIATRLGDSRYLPPEALEALVAAGRLGRVSGHGFRRFESRPSRSTTPAAPTLGESDDKG